MIEFLSNRTVQFVIGLVIVPSLIAAVTILVTLRVNRRKKGLWYKRSIYPVVEEKVDERIQITFDGEVVPDVYVSVVGLRYEGTEPLVEGDFREPLSLDFGEARVLDVEVVAKHPEGVNPSMSVQDLSKVVLTPLALNDGNEIVARVLSTGPRRRPKITGHILGIPEFDDYDKSEYQPIDSFMRTGFVAMVLAPLIIFPIAYFGNEDADLLFFSGAIVPFILIGVAGLRLFLGTRRYGRMWQTERR